MPKQNKQLIEGRRYPFIVMKTLVMRGDDRKFIVLEDPFHNRHLLPADLYGNYNLKPGKKILCHIDKINCDGKIFIEPEHPCYAVGKTYDFEFIRYEKRINQIGASEDVAIVKDVLGNELVAPINEPDKKLKKSMTIPCRVKAIRKGMLHLSLIKRGRFVEHLEVGRSYPFTVKKVARGVDNHDYFVLEDPFGQPHLLRQSYYSHYPISVGRKIQGTVVKFRSDGRFLIEPDHPHYRVGKKYPFTVETAVKELNVQNDHSCFLIVRDSSGETYKVPLNQNPDHYPDLPETVICMVETVRKGKLILSLDESSLK